MRTSTSLILGLLSSVGPAFAATTTSTPTLSLFLLDVASPAPTLQASVISADEDKTAYLIECTAEKNLLRPSEDPCSMLGYASVTFAKTEMELHVGHSTQSISGSGAGTFYPEYFSTTTASVQCMIESNKASCKGGVTSTITSKSNTRSGSETISTVFPDVTGVQVPVTLTGGLTLLPTSTSGSSGSSTTSTSTGAGVPMMTKNALLAGAAAIVGGAMIL